MAYLPPQNVKFLAALYTLAFYLGAFPCGWILWRLAGLFGALIHLKAYFVYAREFDVSKAGVWPTADFCITALVSLLSSFQGAALLVTGEQHVEHLLMSLLWCVHFLKDSE